MLSQRASGHADSGMDRPAACFFPFSFSRLPASFSFKINSSRDQNLRLSRSAPRCYLLRALNPTFLCLWSSASMSQLLLRAQKTLRIPPQSCDVAAEGGWNVETFFLNHQKTSKKRTRLTSLFLLLFPPPPRKKKTKNHHHYYRRRAPPPRETPPRTARARAPAAEAAEAGGRRATAEAPLRRRPRRRTDRRNLLRPL